MCCVVYDTNNALQQLVASILIASMFFTRRKGYSIFDRRKNGYGPLDSDPDEDSARSSDDLIAREHMIGIDDSDSVESMSTTKYPSKKRRCCGMAMLTPNTSRFANNWHSRIMQKFPFTMEMFYWIITYAAYRCTRIASQAVFADTSIWDVAQEHGLAVLEFERSSWLSFLWPVPELEVQGWFLNGHSTFLTVLNRAYALIHIPGTVGYVQLSPHNS